MSTVINGTHRGRNKEIRNKMQTAISSHDMENLSNEEISEKYDVSMSTVGRYRAQSRVPSPIPPKRTIKGNPKLESEIIRKRRDKCSYNTICRELGVSKAYIRTVLAQYGLAEKLKLSKQSNITPDNCMPACYDDLPEPDFEFQEPGVRERYEQLRQWKEEKYHQLLAKKRKRN